MGQKYQKQDKQRDQAEEIRVEGEMRFSPGYAAEVKRNSDS